MKNKSLDLLVCYDIRAPKRLARVYKCMCHWGMPLQYSVFYCKLTKRQRGALEHELKKLIDERVDDVRIYGLKSREAIEFMGQRPYGDNIVMIGPEALEGVNDGAAC